MGDIMEFLKTNKTWKVIGKCSDKKCGWEGYRAAFAKHKKKKVCEGKVWIDDNVIPYMYISVLPTEKFGWPKAKPRKFVKNLNLHDVYKMTNKATNYKLKTIQKNECTCPAADFNCLYGILRATT